jgi:hypothetical protein
MMMGAYDHNNWDISKYGRAIAETFSCRLSTARTNRPLSSLPSCYLATIGGYIDPQTHSSNNCCIVARIRCRGNMLSSRCLATKEGIHFTEPLPSNDRRDTHTDTQTDERDVLSKPLRWAQVSWCTYQVS